MIAHVLHVPASKVVVQVPRMGGGFGGKETQAAAPAALAALAAWKTGRPVRLHWNRDQDMMLTGHRHPFLARFKIGFDSEGRLLAAQNSPLVQRRLVARSVPGRDGPGLVSS